MKEEGPYGVPFEFLEQDAQASGNIAENCKRRAGQIKQPSTAAITSAFDFAMPKCAAAAPVDALAH